jgi:hypothetical protein
LENKRVRQLLLRSRVDRREDVAQTMCTHISKCKNDKRKNKINLLKNETMLSTLTILTQYST